MFGLNAGRYKVAVGRSDDELNVTYNQQRNVSYKQVFHPDVTDQAKATVVELTEGGEANNIDITVGRAVQTFSASGLIVDESGQPLPNLRLGLQRVIGQRIEFMNSFGMSNSRGEFVIEGLIAGKYSIFLLQSQSNGDRRADPFSFDVVDHDVDGLTVKLVKGASVAGTVILESEDKAVLAKLLQLQLRGIGVVSSSIGMGFASSGMSQLGPDGSFRISGLPGGTINLVFTDPGNPMPPKGFTITRVERDGIVSARGLEVKDAEQVMGVRVFVSYGTATLRGVIAVEKGSLPQKERIFVRVTKPGDQFSNMRPAIVDERGHFLMDGLPAGTYELNVNISVPGQSSRTIKREVTLQDGQTTDLTINVDLSEPQKP